MSGSGSISNLEIGESTSGAPDTIDEFESISDEVLEDEFESIHQLKGVKPPPAMVIVPPIVHPQLCSEPEHELLSSDVEMDDHFSPEKRESQEPKSNSRIGF